MDPAVFLYRRKKERIEILSPLFGFFRDYFRREMP